MYFSVIIYAELLNLTSDLTIFINKKTLLIIYIQNNNF